MGLNCPQCGSTMDSKSTNLSNTPQYMDEYDGPLMRYLEVTYVCPQCRLAIKIPLVAQVYREASAE